VILTGIKRGASGQRCRQHLAACKVRACRMPRIRPALAGSCFLAYVATWTLRDLGLKNWVCRRAVSASLGVELIWTHCSMFDEGSRVHPRWSPDEYDLDPTRSVLSRHTAFRQATSSRCCELFGLDAYGDSQLTRCTSLQFVDDVAASLHVRRNDLNITAASKGLFGGVLRIHTVHGNVLSGDKQVG
jgi:hypothetical protein